MTLRFPVLARLIGLGIAGLALMGAGELPATGEAADVSVLQLAPAYDTPELGMNDDVTTPEAALRPALLSTLVSQIADAGLPATDADTRCLARAVYFEARGEPLEGQLAVAQVILNRVASGRFADSACGVIDQPGQFSFAHDRSIGSGNDWRIAEAIARIAVANRWAEIAPRAVNFHAARVAPGWNNMARVTQIGHHVFYR